ncbi:Crp/Fnr family transcriptional regulator [Sphingomicrobium astaxanthinifaciens]|uniref:Crp/Fnr family transcriptional regulator n=1 Tax=Sphingomicrobium astaxanthinifaciens TaxID=1227949 RepID=UPI001FCB8098|nr:Crp/Fnr family transcriptional regulator [Sphingomicrobium astaxanthinifaciens]MCJ7420953.1 Crp/Fnr family transcriptional regulator [Sphingomicrobium astaxanthinifaciens]
MADDAPARDRDRAVDAPTGNALLDMMPRRWRTLFHERGETVDLSSGALLFVSGRDIDRSYFPLQPMMVSLLVEVDDRRRVEVATIGREGAIGGIVSCGDLPAYTRAEVQVAGRLLAVPMTTVEEAKRDDLVVRDLFCRYADALLAQIMQSVACNTFHPIEARAARWLLTAQDRAGDQLALTQGALAALLGVQRTSVNAVARQLQDEGLIHYRRGIVTVTDRAELEHRACECYAAVRRHFDRVLGDEQASWIEACRD